MSDTTERKRAAFEKWLTSSRELNPGCGCQKKGFYGWSVCSFHEGAEEGFDAGAASLREELQKLKRDSEMLHTGCIVEIAVDNQSVRDYVEHWEGRTLKAEGELAKFQLMFLNAMNIAALQGSPTIDQCESFLAAVCDHAEAHEQAEEELHKARERIAELERK